MSHPIDIYEYPSDPSLVPAYRVVVMQAALEGKPLQYRRCDREIRQAAWRPISKPCWNWEVSDYRIDPASKPGQPKLAAGNNPEKLTEEQVETSKGYRLLTESEIKAQSSKEGEGSPDLQPWLPCEKRWGKVLGEGWRGNLLGYCYRTLKPAGFFDLPTTVEGWLKTLPDGYRERALANLKAMPFHPEKTVSSTSQAILYAFIWSETPEGDSFWQKVFGHFAREDGPDLPAPPKKVLKEWRPWTFETVPAPPVLVRPTVNRSVRHLLVGYDLENLRIGVGYLSYCSALHKWEHSLDGGKTWSRCGTEVSVEVDA